jgi:hypothetical protein
MVAVAGLIQQYLMSQLVKFIDENISFVSGGYNRRFTRQPMEDLPGKQ